MPADSAHFDTSVESAMDAMATTSGDGDSDSDGGVDGHGNGMVSSGPPLMASVLVQPPIMIGRLSIKPFTFELPNP